jgi:hypothetical protein
MSSFASRTTIGRRLMLVSVGFLFYTSGAHAGQPAADAQQQAKDLLTGAVNTLNTMPYRSPSIAVGEHWVPNIDPQECARRMILGMPNVGATGPTVVPSFAQLTPDNRRTYLDPQELARRMVLGDEAVKTPNAKRSASMAQGVDSARRRKSIPAERSFSSALVD